MKWPIFWCTKKWQTRCSQIFSCASAICGLESGVSDSNEGAWKKVKDKSHMVLDEGPAALVLKAPLKLMKGPFQQLLDDCHRNSGKERNKQNYVIGAEAPLNDNM